MSFNVLTQSVDNGLRLDDTLPLTSSMMNSSTIDDQSNNNSNSNNIETYYCLLIKEYSSLDEETQQQREQREQREKEQQQQQQSGFHHQPLDKSSYTLTIVQSNASDLQKLNIKSFIHNKSLKNMIFKTGSIGQIEDSNINVMDQPIPKKIVSCYYTLIEVHHQDKKESSNINTTNINTDTDTNTTTTSTITKPIKTTSNLLLNLDLDLDSDDNLDSVEDDENNNNSSTLNINSILEDIEDLEFGLNDGDEGDQDQDLEDSIEKDDLYGLPQAKKKEYYLCLCYEHLETDPNKIEPFHLELGEFCRDIGQIITKDSHDHLSSTLSNWFSTCINYIPRVINLFKDKLPFIIHAVLSGNGFDIKLPKIESKDIVNFIRAISITSYTCVLLSSPNDINQTSSALSSSTHELTSSNSNNMYHYNLTNESSMNDDPLATLTKNQLVLINYDTLKQLNYIGNNGFCKKWSKRFSEMKSDSLGLRNLAEDIKLKVIQELNHFRRMVDSSKFNNYLLYKCYLFLVSNDNSDIMLHLLTKDNVESSIKELISILSNQLSSSSSSP